MALKALKIVFMGTPEFAVPTLEALHASCHEIGLVITQPDRPKGRGRVLMAPPVKMAAQRLRYPVEQPQKIADTDVVKTIAGHEPDALVVAAYGKIIPQNLLDLPALGAVNVHPSLLPKYRGPAPIPWALIEGDSETGVTIIKLNAQMDAGDILMQKETPIEPADTATSLHDRLAKMGAAMLVETLDGLADGTITPRLQDHNRATLAPMLKKSDGRLDWQLNAHALERRIRALNPWPGTFTFYGKTRIKVLSVGVIDKACDAAPGTVLPGFDDELRVATGDGVLVLKIVQGASGKQMPMGDYLRGHAMPPGTRFE
jgi:methionyl-tRNA formyltransferase